MLKGERDMESGEKGVKNRVEKSEEKKKAKVFPKEGKAQFSQRVAERQRNS